MLTVTEPSLVCLHGPSDGELEEQAQAGQRTDPGRDPRRPERSATGPDGSIAHGYLTPSLIVPLLALIRWLRWPRRSET
jgi:hypothetical protein